MSEPSSPDRKPSSPWPPRITSLPSSPPALSAPAFVQMTSSRVVPVITSSAAVPWIVQSLAAPAAAPITPWTKAGPTMSPTVATETKMLRSLISNPVLPIASENVQGGNEDRKELGARGWAVSADEGGERHDCARSVTGHSRASDAGLGIRAGARSLSRPDERSHPVVVQRTVAERAPGWILVD